jgi:hypothetical protein
MSNIGIAAEKNGSIPKTVQKTGANFGLPRSMRLSGTIQEMAMKRAANFKLNFSLY